MSLLEEIRNHRDEILSSARQNGIINVRVFGSAVRGDDTPESDIDLLIDVAKPVRDGLGFVSFKQEVEQLMGREVDIVFEEGLFYALKEIVMKEAQSL